MAKQKKCIGIKNKKTGKCNNSTGTSGNGVLKYTSAIILQGVPPIPPKE